jgi:hypothetical protein
VLKNRGRVRSPHYVEDMVHDLLVVPARRELGLAWLADSMPVTTTTAWLAVEYVGTPLGANVDVLRLRTIIGVNRIPARTIGVLPRPAIVSRPTVTGGPEHLVVLPAATRLGPLGPHLRNIAVRNLPLGPVEVIIGPV